MHVNEQLAQGPRKPVSCRLLAPQDGVAKKVGIPAEHGEPIASRQGVTGSSTMAATTAEATPPVGFQVVDAGRAQSNGH